jgi:transposase
MDIVYACCAGLDVHRATVVACLLRPGDEGDAAAETRTFGTQPHELVQLRTWLQEAGCSAVAMEATGVYWRPVHAVLEGVIPTVLVVNPVHVKAVTGRKTDRQDATRLAHLLRLGMLVGGFVPDQAQRDLRSLTRGRTSLIRDRARLVQRLDKALEESGINLGAVLSDILGTTGQRILDALLAGETDPTALAELAAGRARAKRAKLEAALSSPLRPAQRFLIEQSLGQWRELDARIATFDAQVVELLRPFTTEQERLESIPGIGRRTAEVILAEVGATVDAWPTAGHLAAWAGLAPGQKESAGKAQPARTRAGNPWLKTALVEAAWGATRSRDGFLPARYHRLARRRGKKRALIALAHSLLRIADALLRQGTTYTDLGAHYHDERDREHAKRSAVQRLHRLGYDVNLSDRFAAA